jgi:4-amino-4-deoxy-L-arabinose transferase-like glycosyltransferase
LGRPGVDATDETSSRSGRAIFVERLLILACLLFGAIVRFTPGTPLWLDEALSVNIAKAPLGDIPDLLRRDGHPPLYYWLLHGWIEVFGDGDRAVRALSGVLGLVAIGLVFVVARRFGGTTLGLLAAAVIAVSPYAIRYSSETRMYELVVVLVLIAWLVLDSAMRRPRLPLLAALFLLSGALLLTHYWAMFLLVAVLLVLAYVVWRPPSRQTRDAALRCGIALAAGGVFLLPWVSAMRYQSEHTGTPWAAAPRPTRIASETITDLSGGLYPESILLAGMLFSVLVLALVGRRTSEGTVVLGRPASDWRGQSAAVAGLTAAFGAGLAFATSSAFAGRYGSVYYPVVVLLLAAGIAIVPRGWVRNGVLAAVAVLSMAVVYAQVRLYDRTQAGAVAAAINAEAQAGDLVVVCPDQLGPGLSRLVDTPGVRIVRYPDLGDPRFVDWVDYKERLEGVDPTMVAQRILDEAGPNAIWLNWSDGYRTVGDQCGQLAAYLIAARPGGVPAVTADNVKYFEWSSVIRLPPPPPATG